MISPILANVFLYYVLDLWVNQWRKRQARGNVIIVRYADDFVLGFQHRNEAQRCLAELGQRMQAFGLELHPEKTRLIEFGRFAATDRQRRGVGKPETFDFLGFTHCCGTRRDGGFTVKRKSMVKAGEDETQGGQESPPCPHACRGADGRPLVECGTTGLDKLPCDTRQSCEHRCLSHTVMPPVALDYASAQRKRRSPLALEPHTATDPALDTTCAYRSSLSQQTAGRNTLKIRAV